MKYIIHKLNINISTYERIRELLNNTSVIRQTSYNSIFSVKINSSINPFFVVKESEENEFNIGLELNELIESNICPNVIYTYDIIEKSCVPAIVNNSYVWMYESEPKKSSTLLLLEYVNGKTLNKYYDINTYDFASIIIQIILTLWIIYDKYNRIH